MQEGDRPIKLHLGLFGAVDGKGHRIRGMVGVLLHLISRFAGAASKQDEHQTGTEVQENRTRCALYRHV
jgi:hypothetical protein